jgi:hypothetical protein
LLNIGWFSTGRDEAARQLLQAVQNKVHSGDINGKSALFLATENLARQKKATCSLNWFEITAFLLSAYLPKSSRLSEKNKSGVSNTIER